MKKILSLLLITILITSCQSIPRVTAQERMFVDISLEFLDSYQLAKQKFQDTEVGGLSGIIYDPQTGHFYTLSDDRSQLNHARFYTLNISLNQQNKIDNIQIEKVTFLKDKQGKTFAKGTIDPEGIALSPQNTLYISSEGDTKASIPPFIKEFNLETGREIQNLRIPKRYLPGENKGIQNNLGFEALTLKANGTVPEDPFRLFTATEEALQQDLDPKNPETQRRVRFLHYVINPIGTPILVAEHLYILDPPPENTLYKGLSELMALHQEGYLLSLERTFGITGFGAKIFQVTAANATDTASIDSLKENITNIQPLEKELILDLNTLGITLDNLEGMTFGPRLSDGSPSLILVSDNNFQDRQVTQFLLFKITENVRKGI